MGQNCLFSKGFLIIDQSIARDFSSYSPPIQTLMDRNKATIESHLYFPPVQAFCLHRFCSMAMFRLSHYFPRLSSRAKGLHRITAASFLTIATLAATPRLTSKTGDAFRYYGGMLNTNPSLGMNLFNGV